MTLVEVILGIAILGILAVVVVNALFYPRLLVVSGALKQQAIHAGTDALEQAFSQGYSSLSEGTVSLGDLSTRYSVNGRTVTGFRDVTDVVEALVEYKRITVTVDYGGENPVVLRTYRASL
jgi:type II secretory pathway pseudopilin PulG